MNIVDAALIDTKDKADITTLRTVNRSINAAANGAMSP
jgi:hypothetical protein